RRHVGRLRGRHLRRAFPQPSDQAISEDSLGEELMFSARARRAQELHLPDRQLIAVNHGVQLANQLLDRCHLRQDLDRLSRTNSMRGWWITGAKRRSEASGGDRK